MRLLLPGTGQSRSEVPCSVPSPKLEWLGWEPRFNEASVLPWLFFVPVHMLPRWQELPVEQLCVHQQKLDGPTLLR